MTQKVNTRNHFDQASPGRNGSETGQGFRGGSVNKINTEVSHAKPGSSMASRIFAAKSVPTIPVLAEPCGVPTQINELEENSANQFMDSNKSPYMTRKSLPSNDPGSLQNSNSA